MKASKWISPGAFRAGALLAAAVIVLPACGPDRGSTGGRIDPYRTTDSDLGSQQASIPALLEFTDRTAEELAQDLAALPEINAAAPDRATLELGDILNKTRTSTTDFELIQKRLRGALQRSQLVRSKMRIVESRSRIEAERERVNADPTTNAGGSAKYDPKFTFVLQGDFYEAKRGDRRQYYFEFKLTNLQSREIVYLNQFDLGQVTQNK
jgi:Peptidoglycan-synthase activator LpoB